MTVSNNLYYYNNILDSEFLIDGTFTGLTSWIASGRERGLVNRDPLFIDASGLNFRLIPDSPAIDAGLRVSSVRDMEGNRRPKKSGWDTGAYEL